MVQDEENLNLALGSNQGMRQGTLQDGEILNDDNHDESDDNYDEGDDDYDYSDNES